LEGTSFGRYRLTDLLGRGGMGEVWRARDTETDRIVAVKVLPERLAHDDVFKQRFRREAHAAAQLTEPHVVPIHSYGEIDGRLYVDMRLIEGRDLQAILAQGPLNPARAVMIVDQVAKALQAAHNVGLVHRDVKPSNVLVAEYDFAYLIDFGIARGVDQTGLTNTGSMIGTWAYMAPERFSSGTADARADIYALACVLHECLTGSRPFPGDSLEQQLTGHLTMPPPRPSVARREVPQMFDAVIAKGMAKDPDQRYRTTIELADAARSAATTAIPRLPPPPPPEQLTTHRFAAPPRTQADPLGTRRPDQLPTQRVSTPPPEQLPTHRLTPPPPEQPPTQRANLFAGDEGPPPPPSPGQVTSDEPAEPRPPWHRRRMIVIGAALAVVVLAVATAVGLGVGREQPAARPEIFLEPNTAAGQNPFTPSASIPQPPATNPGTDPAGAPVQGGTVRTVNGELPGLYGGSRNLTTCDTALMVTYLAQNPDKGRAWASVFNITPEQIPAFIAELTPVILRTDTRVTNHGFQDGKATPFQSVLQAGTAVLVDKFGVPRVRCACGNPLLEPVAVTSAVYSDQRWATFSPESLSLVRPSPTVIDTFVLYDPVTGAFFGRPRGGNGSNDVDDPRAAPPPPPATTEAPPPPTQFTRTPTYTRPYTPPPTTTYTPPTTTDTPPTTTYTPPTTTYTPPSTTYTPPSTTYPPPTTTYRRPTTPVPTS
jgi:serine/threonine protein kinase